MKLEDATAMLDGYKRDVAEGRRICSWCRKAVATYVGTFFPDDPQKFGAPEGKERVVVYALCDRCFAIRDQILDDIERDMMRHLNAYKN